MNQTSIVSWLLGKTNTARAPLRSEEEKFPESLELPVQSLKSPSSDSPQSLTASCADSDGMSRKRIPDLPKNVSLEPITKSNIKSFRRHVSLLLPIPYHDAFFAETLEDPVIAELSRIALWHQDPVARDTDDRVKCSLTESAAQAQLVAAIRCRLLDHPPGTPEEEKPTLYISTITTLSPFRRHALASHLLDTVARTAFEKHRVATIVAHVWEANEEGLEWYQKRGFRVVAKKDGYYRRLAPQTAAWIIRKDIGAEEALNWTGEVHGRPMSNDILVPNRPRE